MMAENLQEVEFFLSGFNLVIYVIYVILLELMLSVDVCFLSFLFCCLKVSSMFLCIVYEFYLAGDLMTLISRHQSKNKAIEEEARTV